MSASKSREGLRATLASPTDSAQTYEEYLSQQGNENVLAILLAFQVLLFEVPIETKQARSSWPEMHCNRLHTYGG